MFKINEDKSIHITRGDIANITVSAVDKDGQPYAYKSGDVVRLKVFKKKDCTSVVLEKEVEATEGEQSVDILLSKEDTKVGEVISKPSTYWYEVELNPHTRPQTIIGYDEDGEKLFVLYPEGGDIE